MGCSGDVPDLRNRQLAAVNAQQLVPDVSKTIHESLPMPKLGISDAVKLLLQNH
jgi:hypothetical protein